MSKRKRHAGPTQLVVAFDIGTTYSGISYCIRERRTIPEILGVTRQAFIFDLYRSLFTGHRFPGQELVCGDAKVPSILYYDRSGNVKAAGAEVLNESITEVALTEGWTKAERLVLCRVEVLNCKTHTHPRNPGGSFTSGLGIQPLLLIETMIYPHFRLENLRSTFSQILSSISSSAPRPIFRNIILHSLGQPSSTSTNIFLLIQMVGGCNNSYTAGPLRVPASSPVPLRGDPVSTC